MVHRHAPSKGYYRGIARLLLSELSQLDFRHAAGGGVRSEAVVRGRCSRARRLRGHQTPEGQNNRKQSHKTQNAEPVSHRMLFAFGHFAPCGKVYRPYGGADFQDNPVVAVFSALMRRSTCAFLRLGRKWIGDVGRLRRIHRLLRQGIKNKEVHARRLGSRPLQTETRFVETLDDLEIWFSLEKASISNMREDFAAIFLISSP